MHILIYSSLMMMFNKHLRSQVSLLCVAIFCFMILSLALRNQNSFISFFFYAISYNIIALAIFSFMTFIWNSYTEIHIQWFISISIMSVCYWSLWNNSIHGFSLRLGSFLLSVKEKKYIKFLADSEMKIYRSNFCCTGLQGPKARSNKTGN